MEIQDEILKKLNFMKSCPSIFHGSIIKEIMSLVKKAETLSYIKGGLAVSKKVIKE